MPDDAVTRLEALGGRLEEGDFEALRGALSEEYYGSTPAQGDPAANDQITDLVLQIKAALPDLTASIGDIETSGDELTATLSVRGTHQNELWKAPGDGTVFEWTTPMTVRIDGDRFAPRFDDMPPPARVGLLRQVHVINPPDEMHLPPHHPVEIPEFVFRIAFTGEAGDKPCSHLGDIAVTEPTTDVCQQCVDSGDIWPTLRMCLICGFVGCCDTSTNKHMAKHYEETGHPLFRSIRKGEGWIWCYEDDAFFGQAVLDAHR